MTWKTENLQTVFFTVIHMNEYLLLWDSIPPCLKDTIKPSVWVSVLHTLILDYPIFSMKRIAVLEHRCETVVLVE